MATIAKGTIYIIDNVIELSIIVEINGYSSKTLQKRSCPYNSALDNGLSFTPIFLTITFKYVYTIFYLHCNFKIDPIDMDIHSEIYFYCSMNIIKGHFKKEKRKVSFLSISNSRLQKYTPDISHLV